MSKILGIEFASLNVPIERRKQTFAILIYQLIYLFGIYGGPILIWLLTTRFSWLLVLYFVFIFYGKFMTRLENEKSETR